MYVISFQRISDIEKKIYVICTICKKQNFVQVFNQNFLILIVAG